MVMPEFTENGVIIAKFDKHIPLDAYLAMMTPSMTKSDTKFELYRVELVGWVFRTN